MRQKLNFGKYGTYENVPERSTNQIIDHEIEMVKNNKFLDDQDREKLIKKLIESKEK